MIIDAKTIYERFDNPDMIKSIGITLFKVLKQKIVNPEALIMDMGQLGNFYFRKGVTKPRSEYTMDDEIQSTAKKILDLYDEFDKDKYEFKCEKFGKESHDSYIVAKKQKKVQRFKKIDYKQYMELSGGGMETSVGEGGNSSGVAEETSATE